MERREFLQKLDKMLHVNNQHRQHRQHRPRSQHHCHRHPMSDEAKDATEKNKVICASMFLLRCKKETKTEN